MTKIGERYRIEYDNLEQQINFEGTLRIYNIREKEEIKRFLIQIYNESNGTLKLNFRKLRYVNAVSLKIIAEFLKFCKDKGKLKIKFIGSNVITWEIKTLPNLVKIWEDIDYEIYDENFYESQNIIEDDEFIPLLKNQSRLIWAIEKDILIKHGFKKGMKVADICCGVGDISLLIARELEPASIIGIDHSVPSIEHARKLQEDLGVRNAEFHLGDATALMIEDNTYDYVISRLSIQIFSKPELILKELYRITKPGGRIYLLGEDYDMIVGYPNNKEILKVYDKAGMYGTQMGMDLYNGKKLYTILNDMKLTNIKIDPIIVDTNNSRRELFAEMVRSWRKFSVFSIGNSLGIDEEEKERLLRGYDAHLNTINHPHGYTTWTLIAGSGEKSL